MPVLKAKALEVLEENWNRLQALQKASTVQIQKADKILTRLSDKLDAAYGQHQAKI